MNVQHILNRGRQLAESLMTDQCRVTHMGKPVTDPETGLVEPAANTVYEGRCKVQTSGGLAVENTEGGIVKRWVPSPPYGRCTCISPMAPLGCCLVTCAR